jgi:glycosyltransferase involved in cell wall biosynthesis
MKEQSKLDVTILLPCYNEEEALHNVITDIRKTMNSLGYSYEILVVDDNSTDQSMSIAKELDCRVIHHSTNRGAGAARKTGILSAFGESIVMLDADGTYRAVYIPKMLELLTTFDQVNGTRISEQGTLRWLRSPIKWFIRKLASFLVGQLIPDLNTGLKAFKRDIMIPYLWTVPDGFSCVTSMTLAFLCNGHSVTYIPIEYHKRIGKSKFHPIKDTYMYLLAIFRVITYFNPLKIFMPIAIWLVMIGIIKSLYDFFFVIQRLQLSDIILLITGLVIGLQGLIADLIVAQSRARSMVVLADKMKNNKPSFNKQLDG